MRILYAAPFQVNELRKIARAKDVSHELSINRENFLFPLLYNVVNRGHEICIVTASRSIRNSESYDNGPIHIEIVKIWSHGRASAFNNFKTDIRRIADAIKQCKSDVYHAQWSYEYAAACLEIAPSKTVVTVRDWPDLVCPMIGNFYWKRKNILGNNVIGECGLFTATSPCMISRIKEKKKDVNVYLIPNYYNHINGLNKEHNKQDCYRIVCVNDGFSKIKNVSAAIRAFEVFHREVPNSRLALIGDGFGEGEEAYRYSLKNNISISGVIFIGKVKHEIVEAKLAESDIFLHTSLEESFGKVYLEAMSAGIPIIAGRDAGATSWVLRDGECGMLVDVTDINDIKRGLKELCQSPELCDKYIENGRKRLMDFSLEKIIPEYLNLYEYIGRGDE